MPIINKKQKKELLILFFLVLSLIISILLARKFSSYNILIAFPFLLVMASSFFEKNNDYPKKIAVGLITFCFLGPLINNLMEQVKLKYRPVNKTIVLSHYLKKIIKEEETIFSFDNGLYLLLDKKLPTKISHPASFFRHYILKSYYDDPNHTTEVELNKILDKDSNYMVMLEIWHERLPDSI
jgi:hypothetical protein|tara:strand:+ start:293 stop:838 length:546 start_codon:yes stop_codon:yes gene_type:complete